MTAPMTTPMRCHAGNREAMNGHATNRLLLCLAALAVAACTPDFEPASRVDRLRVLAVRADPPEIEPAGAAAAAPDRAALTAFVVRPGRATDPGRETTVLYLACLPVPGDPSPTPCAAFAGLRDPAALVAEAARGTCAGEPVPAIGLAGLEICAGASCGAATVAVAGAPVTLPRPELALPAGYGFGSLPEGSPERILGLEAEVLAFALDATAAELGAAAGSGCALGDVAAEVVRLWPAREHVLSTKRVRVRGPEAIDPPNRNPALDGISADGVPLAAVAPPSSVATGKRQLRPVLPPDAPALQELYTRIDAAGAPIERKPEEWVYSWFATAGEIDDLHTREPSPDAWTIPSSASGGRALVAAVVRDLRGGTAWVVREVEVGR